MFYLPTLEECMEIVENNDSFIEKNDIVKGFNVKMFNYLLAGYNDFKKPLKNKDITAFELRGLTFVEDPKTKEWKRFLMLHKFFNLNQCEDYMYDDLSDLKIDSILDKRDGSMIRFINLPDGSVVAKTKMGFDNEQCKLAQKLYDKDINLQNFIKESLENSYSAIFELTSPINRIVLSYSESELTLLQMRNEENGFYENIYENELVLKNNIKTVESLPIESLDHFINLRESAENIEGWIFQSKQKMWKLKTQWYCDRHGILTDSLARENILAHIILEEKLDDTMSILDKKDPRRKSLLKLEKAIQSYIKTRTDNVLEFVNENYLGDIKSFSIKHSKHDLFGLSMIAIRANEGSKKDLVNKRIIDITMKDTYKLKKAQIFFEEKLNFDLQAVFVDDEA